MNGLVWIDQRVAKIVKLDAQGGQLEEVQSEVEEGNVTGGYGSSKKYLGQDAVADDKMQERKNHQLNSFFDRVENALDGLTTIVVIGPGEARVHFGKHAEQANVGWSIVENKVSDSMTDNQLIAMAKAYFYGDSEKELQDALSRN